MKRVHFDVEEDGFYGAYWACKDTHTAAGTDSIEPCPLSYAILFFRTSVLFQLSGVDSDVPSFQLRSTFHTLSHVQNAPARVV